MLPASDADDWFTAGSAAYYRDFNRTTWRRPIAAHWAAYRSASIGEPNAMNKFAAETHRGALVLDQMRRDLGDDRFFKLMADFFASPHHPDRHRPVVSGCRGR